MQLIGPDMLASINEKFANTPRRITTGGAACNTMMALAQLGMKPGVVGMIGRDRFGTLFKQSFIEAGADVRLQECDLPTGVASTFITPDGQRTFGTCLGAAGNMKPEDLTDDIFKGYDILFVEGYLVQDHSLISRILEIGKAAGMRICLDMASYTSWNMTVDFLQHIVDRYVDIVFANEDEAYAFTQLPEQDAVADLARRCEVAVVKVGARGAYIRRATNKYTCRPKTCTSSTPTQPETISLRIPLWARERMLTRDMRTHRRRTLRQHHPSGRHQART